MKELLLGGIIFIWVVDVNAQGPDTLWTKTYGGSSYEEGRSVQQTSDGGYIIGGETSSYGAGSYDIYLIKTDANGDTLWTRTYGGTMSEYGYYIQQTTDGGYIIVGNTYSFGAGDWDVYVLKTDDHGDTLWGKILGGAEADNGYCVQQTTDGGYIIVGNTYSFGAGADDVWLIKIDSNGNTIWTKTYGGNSNDAGQSVQQTNDGGYVIAGWTYSFGAGWSDVYLIKTDANGDTLWTKTYGLSESERGHSVQQTTDGGYIIAGYTRSFGSNEPDFYLVKTDTDGDTLWTKHFGGIESDEAYSVKQVTDGGYIIVGSTWSFGAGYWDIYVIRTNADGDTLWTQIYGGTKWDRGFSVIQTTDSGYMIAGYTQSFGAGGYDVWLLKTEPDIGVEEETDDKVDNLRIPSMVCGGILELSGIKKNVKIKIFDPCGREILSQDVSPQKSYIRLNNLTSGVYFLSIKEEKPGLHKFVLIR